MQKDAFNTHWPSAIRKKDYLSCIVSVSQSFFFLSSLRKEKKKYAKEYDTKKMSSLISRIKVKMGKFSTVNSFYANISQRLRSSWVNFKFRRCICSDTPSTNQVFSISLRTASRRWLKACSRFCLRMAVSSGLEAFFRFFWDGCCICSRQHYSSAFFDPLISSYPHSFRIKDCHLGFDFHSHYCWCSVTCESHHYVNFSVWIAGKDVERMNFSSLSQCEKLYDLQFYRTIIGGNRQFK